MSDLEYFLLFRYARPATGGHKVRHHNFNHDVQDAVEEVKHLCRTIRQCGHKNSIDGSIQITFGELFDVYLIEIAKLSFSLKIILSLLDLCQYLQ